MCFFFFVFSSSHFICVVDDDKVNDILYSTIDINLAHPIPDILSTGSHSPPDNTPRCDSLFAPP